MTIEYREAADVVFRTVGDETDHEVEAKVCSYGVGPDTYNTTWARGVFAESLSQSLPAMCWGHDARNVVGSAVSWRDEADGCYVRLRFADFNDVPQARAAWSLLKDGHVKGWSFGFADGKSIPDPEHRGAMQFTEARLFEVSPVVRPSVPGTQTIAVRSEAAAEGVAVQIADAIRSAATDQRSLTITIGDDGSVSTSGTAPASTATASTDNADGTDTAEEPAGTDDENALSPEQWACAVDSALDAAVAALGDTDTSGLPANVQTALSLLIAAEVAADELLDALGIDDPDEPVERDAEVDERAAKPYGDVTYADPGYQADKKPRYPLDTEAHIRAAWAYINQDDNAKQYSPEQLAKIKAAIRAAAKKVGVNVADSNARAAALDVEVALALGGHR